MPFFFDWDGWFSHFFTLEPCGLLLSFFDNVADDVYTVEGGEVSGSALDACKIKDYDLVSSEYQKSYSLMDELVVTLGY